MFSLSIPKSLLEEVTVISRGSDLSKNKIIIDFIRSGLKKG